jgi:uncharacterized lipoprotein YddW (UPF0748 family)
LLALALVGGVLLVVASAGVMRWTAQQQLSAAADVPTAPARPGVPTCAGHPTDAPRELRGMWIATVNNIDWPSKPGLDQETVKAQYRSLLDLAQRLNFNAVFVHIRPSGDALWPSRYDPWSEWLTGKRDGQSPGWDPLQFLVSEAHARNLEFHAWFNPYRAGQPAPDGAGPDIGQLAPNHPLRQHPDWAVVYPVNATGSRLYYNPGIPEARRLVEDAMLDAVARYDVDGVHFDDFYYPYPVAGQDFPDDATFAQYGAGFASKGNWRRDNVNKLIQEMSQRVKVLKPWVKFGVSPFGIWRNHATDPLGSDTRGLESYDEIYADTRLWVKQGWLDYIVPQLYWNIGFELADYARLLPWWSDVVAGTGVQLYIGQADYRVGQPGAWSDPAELDRQLVLNQQYQVQGSIHFSARSVAGDKLGAVSRYVADRYATPALVPMMPRLPESAPPAPALTTAQRDAGGGVRLAWQSAGRTTASFAIYRLEGTGNVAHLVGTTRERSWVDKSAEPGQRYTYCVAAMDRLWNSGSAGGPRKVG